MVDKPTNTSGNGFGKGLIVGSLVGAAIALLCAPQTGAKLRKDVRKKASGLRGDLNRYTLRLKNQANGLLGKIQSGTNGARHNRRIHA